MIRLNLPKIAFRGAEVYTTHAANLRGLASIIIPSAQSYIDYINDLLFVRTTPGEYERRLQNQQEAQASE